VNYSASHKLWGIGTSKLAEELLRQEGFACLTVASNHFYSKHQCEPKLWQGVGFGDVVLGMDLMVTSGQPHNVNQ